MSDPRSDARVPVWEGRVENRFQNGTGTGLGWQRRPVLDPTVPGIADAIIVYFQYFRWLLRGFARGYSRHSSLIGLERAFSKWSEE
jgi:hypothetical protein